MVRRISALFLLLLFLAANAVYGQISQPVGEWNTHLTYRNGQLLALTHDRRLFCLTDHGLFFIRPDGKSIPLAKEDGLSGSLPVFVAYSPERALLAIAYENGLIDLIDTLQNLYLITEIHRKQTATAKRINDLYFVEDTLYIATSLGLLKYDLRRRYVIENYRFIGSGGSEVEAFATVQIDDTLYTATDQGILAVPLNAPNRLDFQAWKKISPLSTRLLLNFGGRLVAVLNNDLVSYHHGQWSVIISGDSLNEKPFTRGHVTGPYLAMGSRYHTYLIDTAWDVQTFDVISFDALYDTARDILWIAQAEYGTMSYYFESGQWYFGAPPAPWPYTAYRLLGVDSTMYVAAGGQANWLPTYNTGGFAWFSNGQWTNYPSRRIQEVLPAADQFRDAMALAYRRKDQSLFVGSYVQGLLQVQDGQPTRLFTARNAPLDSADDGRTPIVSLYTDLHDNLWMVNQYSSSPIRVLDTDNRWHAFRVPEYTLLGDFVVDHVGQFWGRVVGQGGLLLYSTRQTPANTADDQYIRLTTEEGHGNLPSMNVTALAIDRDSVLWIGTDDGVAVIDFPEFALEGEGNYDARRIVLIDEEAYLLEGLTITAIAVDAGNNKWIGTTEGVFYVSPDGRTLYQHFTAENSPLLSNNIISIDVIPHTGEVFFGTDKGMCSYQGLAVETPLPPERIKIYPNPVHEQYSGPIMIENVPANARIRIVDVAGNLVYADRAVGNRAIWEGVDMQGKHVRPGVYFVAALPREKGHTFLGKVLILRK